VPHVWLPVCSALLLAGLCAAPASAAEQSPASLSVSLSGPATGTPGGSAEWSIGVANADGPAAQDIRLTLSLPEQVSVASVGVSDDWACVVAPEDRSTPLTCQLEQPLPPGQSADPVPVTLTYGQDASGTLELAAIAQQGRDGAVQLDRGTARVTFAAPTSPSPSPGATAAPAAPASPPAPRPAATRAPTTTRTAPAAPAPAASEQPVDTQAAPQEPAVAAPAPVGTQPSSLPFVDDDPTEQASPDPVDEPADDTDLAAATADDGSDVSTLVLGWLVGVTLLALLVLGWRMATGRAVPLGR
jgi:hypothetical protein